MNPVLAIVLALLAVAILMFAFNRPRADAVALIAMVALPFTGTVTMPEAIAGFSNPNVVLIAAMFVIGEALARTGVAQRIGDWLARSEGTSPWRLLVLLMLAVGLLGSVMSSTGVVAIFIPVVLRIASQTGLPAAQLLMPMAYASLISGTLTRVATSSNLAINYELVRTGVEGFGFFAFTPFGLPILAIGVLYMLLARRWLSPDAPATQGRRRPRLMHWVEHYRLADRELRVRVRTNSPLLSQPVGALNLTGQTGVRLLLVKRGRGATAASWHGPMT
jgi:di/tricarboxylate transporter